ncbi:conserved hypothetical protein, partial [Ricinus communis]
MGPLRGAGPVAGRLPAPRPRHGDPARRIRLLAADLCRRGARARHVARRGRWQARDGTPLPDRARTGRRDGAARPLGPRVHRTLERPPTPHATGIPGCLHDGGRGGRADGVLTPRASAGIAFLCPHEPAQGTPQQQDGDHRRRPQHQQREVVQGVAEDPGAARDDGEDVCEHEESRGRQQAMPCRPLAHDRVGRIEVAFQRLRRGTGAFQIPVDIARDHAARHAHEDEDDVLGFDLDVHGLGSARARSGRLPSTFESNEAARF